MCVYDCLLVCMCTVCVHDHGGQKTVDALELGFWAAVGHHVGPVNRTQAHCKNSK